MGIRELRAKYDTAFQAFFEAYPRRTHKQEAIGVFVEMGEAGEDLNEIITKAQAYSQNVDPNDLKYVPAPHRWLRDKRWEDNDLFQDQRVANREWFVKVYHDADAATVEKRFGFIFPDPPVPAGCPDVQAWHRDCRKTWIGAVARHVLHGEPLPE